MTSARTRAIRPFFWALLSLSLPALAAAQQADDPARQDTVSWSIAPQDVAKPDARLTLTLHGTVLDGWHVYSLKQVADGPTPLEIHLDANDVAVADGAIGASPSIKVFEPAFGAQTQIYAKPFTLSVPVRLKPHLPPGAQSIPVSVRFQTCNGRVCQPPKTVHLLANVNLQAAK